MKKLVLLLFSLLVGLYGYAQNQVDVIRHSTIGASTATVLSYDELPPHTDHTKIIAIIVQIVALILPFFFKKKE
jgi:hypothetical protein